MKARTSPPRGARVIRAKPKVKKDAPEVLTIDTGFIKLESALKFSGVCMTGGEAKELVASGKVTVNGEVCLQRGKKLRDGDSFNASGKSYVISDADKTENADQES